MSSHGIKDRVAIVGMGCTPFIENWGKGLDDLMIDAANDAYASAGVTKDDIDAYWFGLTSYPYIYKPRNHRKRQQEGANGRNHIQSRKSISWKIVGITT